MKAILHLVIFDRTKITDEAIAGYILPYQDNGLAVRCFFSAVNLLTDPRLPDELHSIDQPICIVWGAKDKLVPYKTMVELRQILPQSQWKEHALGGHHIMEDQPEWICSEIVNFVDLTTRSQYIDR